MQPQGNVGIFGRIRRRLFEVHLIKGQLLGTFAGNVLVMNGLDAEVVASGRVHVVSRCHAVEHIGLEHGVVLDAIEVDVVALEDMRVVLQVMTDFLAFGVFEERTQRLQHVLAIELFRCAGVVVCHRDVASLTRRHGQGDADKLCLHIFEAGGLCIDGDQFGVVQLFEPAFEVCPGEDRLVAGVIRFRRRRFAGSVIVSFVQLAQQSSEFQPCVKLPQHADVHGAALEVSRLPVELDVLTNRCQLLRQA